MLAPPYELARQITGEARDLSQKAGLGIRVQGLIGGANIARQIDKLKEKPQLVVGSAGRILELARKGKLKLTGVRFLVLDEFDLASREMMWMLISFSWKALLGKCAHWARQFRNPKVDLGTLQGLCSRRVGSFAAGKH